MSRRPKPTELKALAGNPGKRKLNTSEPKPDIGIPDPPGVLTREALFEWNLIVPQLIRMGVLTKIDRVALAGYCQSFARWSQAERIIEREGLVVNQFEVTKDGNAVLVLCKTHPAVGIADRMQKAMRAFLTMFGLDPSSRSRLHVAQPKSEIDDLDSFLNEKPMGGAAAKVQ